MKEGPMDPVRFNVSDVYVTIEKDGDRYATIAEYPLGK
jgi:hypothetical protein